MKILVINSGSSSLKYQLFDIETEKVIAKGLCDRIGVKGATGAFTFKTDSEKYQTDVDMPDHAAALKIVLDTLVSKERGHLVRFRDRGGRTPRSARRRQGIRFRSRYPRGQADDPRLFPPRSSS